MGTKLAVAARNKIVDAIVDMIDIGAGTNGKIRVYTGAQPTNPDTAVGGATMLVEFTLPDPAFSAAASGTATLNGLPLVAQGVAAGTAGFFRVIDQDGNAVYDGTAGTSGAELILNTTTISIGVDVQITAGSFTMPVGS